VKQFLTPLLRLKELPFMWKLYFFTQFTGEKENVIYARNLKAQHSNLG
jgi:hypothetical protein